MAGVELGARYKAGKDGARIVFASGSVAQLAPFATVLFTEQPKRIEGRLIRVVKGKVLYEAPALEPSEVK